MKAKAVFIPDIRLDCRGHCPWIKCLSFGEILDVEKGITRRNLKCGQICMWRNFSCGDILNVEKSDMWRNIYGFCCKGYFVAIYTFFFVNPILS